MILNKKHFLFILILLFLITYCLFNYINFLQTSSVVKINTYYFLKKNTSQRSIIEDLNIKNIKISFIEWKLISFLNSRKFIPKAGEYLIPKDSTIFDIQKILHNGKTITRSFTLIEGTTALQLKQKLLDNQYMSGKIDNLAEGIYKPDTYNFKYGFPRKKMLERMRVAQENIINKIWKKKPKLFILKNKNELLTLASIIQKEAKNLNDSRLIASVFINRLEKKMKLQSDVTLAYGFKVNGNKITKKMLKSDHPYNTYYHFGLPPTPISYPGENALRSLENIQKTDYLFFVSDGNGEHRFSKTYRLHKKNIRLWKNKILKESDVK